MLGDKWHSDTVLLSLLSTLNLHHSSVLQDFITWCEGACLQLNSTKTKEVIVTFSSKQRQLAEAITTFIWGEPVEVVEEYRYLGTIFDSLLRFSTNTEEILKKCLQRQYLLRKLGHVYLASPKSALKSLDTLLELCLLSVTSKQSALLTGSYMTPHTLSHQASGCAVHAAEHKGGGPPLSPQQSSFWTLTLPCPNITDSQLTECTQQFIITHFDCDGHWKYWL